MDESASRQEAVCKDLGLLSLEVPSTTRLDQPTSPNPPRCADPQNRYTKDQRDITSCNANMPPLINLTLPIRLAPKRPASPEQQNPSPRQVLFTPAESDKLPPGFMYPITPPIATGLPQNHRPRRFSWAAPTTQSLLHPPSSQGTSPRKRRPRRNHRKQDLGPSSE